MGTATNDSAQTSPSDTATPAATEMSQPHDELVIIPTSEERYDNDAIQNKPRVATGRHLGHPSIMQKLFGWLI